MRDDHSKRGKADGKQVQDTKDFLMCISEQDYYNMINGDNAFRCKRCGNITHVGAWFGIVPPSCYVCSPTVSTNKITISSEGDWSYTPTRTTGSGDTILSEPNWTITVSDGTL